MIHPENANPAIDQLIMAIADLGVDVADISVSAFDGPITERLSRLEVLGTDIVSMAAAARAIARNRAERVPSSPE
ncbi:hypothetical protein BH10PSE2_BH10PSE2_10620 [soil metagenome]